MMMTYGSWTSPSLVSILPPGKVLRGVFPPQKVFSFGNKFSSQVWEHVAEQQPGGRHHRQHSHPPLQGLHEAGAEQLRITFYELFYLELMVRNLKFIAAHSLAEHVNDCELKLITVEQHLSNHSCIYQSNSLQAVAAGSTPPFVNQTFLCLS